MLTIRDTQMRALASAAEQEFERRLAEHLNTATSLPLDQLRAMLPAAIRAADELGISREKDVALLLEMVHRLTGGFLLERLPTDAQNLLLTYKVDGEEKMAQLAKWVDDRGEALPKTTTFTSRIPSSVVRPCASPERTTAVHWIEIELVGEDDRPIPGEEYRIHLPNGDVVRGYLNEKGQARVANIDTPGECAITFPSLDQDAWTPHKTI